MTSAAEALPGTAMSDRATWRAFLVKPRALTREETLASSLLAGALIVFTMVTFTRQFDIRFVLQLPAQFALKLIACLTLLLGVAAVDAVTNVTARRIALVLAVVVSGLVDSMLLWLRLLLGGFGYIGVYILLLGFVIARGVKRKNMRWAVAAFAIVIAGLAFSLGWRELVGDPQYVKAVEDGFAFARWSFYRWLLLAGAATFGYLDWRKTRVARARRHAAEMDRARSAKHALESRLQAMQARVEPQFLFNTLSQVRDLYHNDAACGEHMLDELIAYLRAAMPKMRDTASTVGQELELARAYLAIVSLRYNGRLSYEIEPPDARVAEARMPPMMLLPLLDHAIAHRFVEPRAIGLLRIRAGIANGSVRLEVSDSGAGFQVQHRSEAIDGIRERLTALYGDEATLELRTENGGAAKAVLEFPLEPEGRVAEVPIGALPSESIGARALA